MLSAGCGQAATLQSGTATIDVSGTSRTYILQIPSNYDPSKPYKLIFSTGFSYGGIFSLTLGCQMSNVFRAIAPESGELFHGCNSNGGPVAVWQSQGDSDTTVPPANAQSANSYFVTKNHCSTQATAVSPTLA